MPNALAYPTDLTDVDYDDYCKIRSLADSCHNNLVAVEIAKLAKRAAVADKNYILAAAYRDLELSYEDKANAVRHIVKKM